ncbi:hypothetical protein bmyco0003_58820 [Bacillus pseudomycoides]|nr:hypothetical protein bmyco0003_58820 [Bacillus pseudomycoides]
MEEKRPIVIENIQEAESKVFEIEDAIAVLKKFNRGDDEE